MCGVETSSPVAERGASEHAMLLNLVNEGIRGARLINDVVDMLFEVCIEKQIFGESCPTKIPASLTSTCRDIDARGL